ncbi:MAG: hypothetical protein LBG92_10650 [Prevotellaceae bacterium]|nr:hypothetical protein [Prevotellaceae bacterium]
MLNFLCVNLYSQSFVPVTGIDYPNGTNAIIEIGQEITFSVVPQPLNATVWKPVNWTLTFGSNSVAEYTPSSDGTSVRVTGKAPGTIIITPSINNAINNGNGTYSASGGFTVEVKGSSGCNLTIPGVGGEFQDCTGVWWRVINEDGNGNKLILTRYVYYNNSQGFAPVESQTIYHSNTYFEDYKSSTGTTRPRMNEWYKDQTSSVLKAMARIPNLGYESNGLMGGSWSADMNISAAYSSAGSAPASGVTNEIVFPLSISEINQYVKKYGIEVVRGRDTNPNFNQAGRQYWLRSPGAASSNPLSVVLSLYTTNTNSYNYKIDHAYTTFKASFRPAMWIRP